MHRSKHVLKIFVKCCGAWMVGQRVRYIFQHHREQIGKIRYIPIFSIVTNDKQIIITVWQFFTDFFKFVYNRVPCHFHQFSFSSNHVVFPFINYLFLGLHISFDSKGMKNFFLSKNIFDKIQTLHIKSFINIWFTIY